MNPITTEELDLAVKRQALEIELALWDLREREAFYGSEGRRVPIRFLQGGLERSQRRPHKPLEPGSTPGPATNSAPPEVCHTSESIAGYAAGGESIGSGGAVSVSLNANAAAFHQVHVFPKGRWS